MSDKSKYNFKCLEQKCATRACHTRPHVNVTIGDLGRWAAQGYLMNILPGISLRLPEKEDDRIAFETARKPLEGQAEETCCIFFNEKANGCEIRYSRPISCRTYPLEYNGEKYYLSSKDCAGVGQGEVNKQVLQEARNLAEQEFKERTESDAALPGVYSVIMTELIRQSAEAMKKRSEEEKKETDESASGDSEEHSTSSGGEAQDDH